MDAAEKEMDGYARVLEGYGDMCRSLHDVLEDVKTLRKQCNTVQDYLPCIDPQELSAAIQGVSTHATWLCRDVVVMLARLNAFQRVALPDGDLLTMAEDDHE